MKQFMVIVFCACLSVMAACGGGATDSRSGAAAPPSGGAPQAAKSSLPAATSRTSAPRATIDITTSGPISGSSTELSAAKDNKCVSLSAASMVGTYALNLYPIIGGKTTHFALLVGKFKGPVEVTLPPAESEITCYLSVGEDSGDTKMYMVDKGSTGTVSVTSSGGSVDLKGLQLMMGAEKTPLDIKVTWSCRE